MGEAIGQSLAFAIVVALGPPPIIAAILVLVTPRARTNGPALAIGCLSGLAIVGAVLLLLADPAGANDDGDPATWVGILQVVLGVAAVLLGLGKWRGRPKTAQPEATPKWIGAIESLTAPKAFGLGVVLAGANPKNLLLAAAAAATIAETGLSGGEQAIAYAVFAVIGTIGVAAPVVIYFALGADRARPILADLQTWLSRHGAAIMTVMLLVIGAKLIGDGIAGL